jgi:hypothetical protein
MKRGASVSTLGTITKVINPKNMMDLKGNLKRANTYPAIDDNVATPTIAEPE